MDEGVAISRGKGIPTRTFIQRNYESRHEFITRVVNEYELNLDKRNTLTLEFVWDTHA